MSVAADAGAGGDDRGKGRAGGVFGGKASAPIGPGGGSKTGWKGVWFHNAPRRTLTATEGEWGLLSQYATPPSLNAAPPSVFWVSPAQSEACVAVTPPSQLNKPRLFRRGDVHKGPLLSVTWGVGRPCSHSGSATPLAPLDGERLQTARPKPAPSPPAPGQREHGRGRSDSDQS